MAVVINQELCKGCKICVKNCPFQAIDFDETTKAPFPAGTLFRNNCY